MPANNKFRNDDYFYPPVEDTSRLLVGCSRADYSASRIARAVEDCDAHLLNLNVISMNGSRDYTDDTADEHRLPVIADIRVTHRNAAAVAKSLERYGYSVIDWESADAADDDTARERIDHLFRYLEL